MVTRMALPRVAIVVVNNGRAVMPENAYVRQPGGRFIARHGTTARTALLSVGKKRPRMASHQAAANEGRRTMATTLAVVVTHSVNIFARSRYGVVFINHGCRRDNEARRCRYVVTVVA